MLCVVAEVEELDRTLRRFPGLTKDELRAILRSAAGLPDAQPETRPLARAESRGTPQMEGEIDRVVLWTDGASRGNPGPAAIGVHIEEPGGRKVGHVSRRIGVRTNNYAEYEAVRAGLEYARHALGAKKAAVNADSELVVRQLTGVYRVKNADLRPLFEAVKRLEEEFPGGVSYRHVRRESNVEADRLANLALDES